MSGCWTTSPKPKTASRADPIACWNVQRSAQVGGTEGSIITVMACDDHGPICSSHPRGVSKCQGHLNTRGLCLNALEATYLPLTCCLYAPCLVHRCCHRCNTVPEILIWFEIPLCLAKHLMHASFRLLQIMNFSELHNSHLGPFVSKSFMTSASRAQRFSFEDLPSRFLHHRNHLRSCGSHFRCSEIPGLQPKKHVAQWSNEGK